MTKKSRKANVNDPAADESVEQKSDVTESGLVKTEAGSSSNEMEQAEETESAAPEETLNVAEDVSVDDLLDDVRRSLIEDEAENAADKPAWWKKGGKGKPKDQAEDVTTPMMDIAPAELGEESKDDTEYLEQIDELIDKIGRAHV